MVPGAGGTSFPVKLDASRSFDQDGDPLSFTWRSAGSTVDGPVLELAGSAAQLPRTVELEVADGEHTIAVTIHASIDADAAPDSIAMPTVYLDESQAAISNFRAYVADMLPSGCAEPLFAINSYDASFAQRFPVGTTTVHWVFAYADGSRVRSEQLVVVRRATIHGGASGCSYAGAAGAAPAGGWAFAAALGVLALVWRRRMRASGG